MSDLLKGLEIRNFRSIRGNIHAPLDAKVVLVHGENGAGKTSLLSAIELALTGRVQSLERADQAYERQLLHRSADKGSVEVKALLGGEEQGFEALLSDSGVQSSITLDRSDAAFFRERVFLPQSLLGQLLQIYQDAGDDAESPLAKFVGKLLGLDCLDALEAGLKPLSDVRNVRKIVDGWSVAENEKSRFDRLIADQRTVLRGIKDQIDSALEDLAEICNDLGLTIEVNEKNTDLVDVALKEDSDTLAFEKLTDQQRRLNSLRREIATAQTTTASSDTDSTAVSARASKAYADWQSQYGDRIADFRARAEKLFPDVSLESAPDKAASTALKLLRAEERQLTERVTHVRKDLSRYATAQDEREIALRQRDTIDTEIEQLPSSAGSLGAALSELTSFITNETCPVCDRDFDEVTKVSLSQHVHAKVRTLSASAERLLTLGRTLGETQATIERLEQEIETIEARKLGDEVLAELDRRLSNVKTLIVELDDLSGPLEQGGHLLAADIAARRAVSEAQARHVALATARDSLSEFALAIDGNPIAEGETFDAGFTRLAASLVEQTTNLEARLSMRRRGGDLIATIRSALVRREQANARIAEDLAGWERAEKSLERAQALRDQGNAVRNEVDAVRSAIIRREFNERLNRVWRDLFVRLAPGEPFVPAFKIPPSSTRKLQPKLITKHRDGGEVGGTPGAMLSAGNLNTAALTLFIALHMSVPKQLPWLILDDPVQSMDDVHIAHFAALLRTLSKEHSRQIMIAVHDRQLFEYLKLELSPAFAEDSLLTLELSRGLRRDSVCISRRYSFQKETALLFAA